jgi:hypothetical protein
MLLWQRVETVKQGLEEFINILLTKPATAGDEALCTFLNVPPVAVLYGLVWMISCMCVRIDWYTGARNMQSPLA